MKLPARTRLSWPLHSGMTTLSSLPLKGMSRGSEGLIGGASLCEKQTDGYCGRDRID